MKRFLHAWIALLFVLFTTQTWAQERTVSGRVTSAEDDSPIPGVNVLVKGTTVGTSTDADGKYTLSYTATGGSLVFSFIGLESKEVEIGDRTTVDVSLSLDVTQLSEVVVVGYGTQDRRTVTSAQTSISGSALSSLAAPSFDTQLAGRSAGVQVTVATGIIGQTPTINIRGVNSISSGTFPLVVLDGVPMITGNQSAMTPTNPLADINPADIESYEILKDGAATAIYGSRAANGVILITTKRGSKNKGKLNVDFSVSAGYSEAVDKFDILNSTDFITIANEKLSNSGSAPGAFADPEGVETDWQDVILRNGSFVNYNLGVSGSTQTSNYFFSASYQEQEGAVVANYFDRLSFRSNLDHKFNKYLEMGTGISVSRTNTKGLNTGSNALSGNISSALRLFPNVSPYDDTDPTGYNLSPDNSVLGSGSNTRNIDNNYTNAAFVLDNNQQNAKTDRILTNIYGKVNFMEGLSARTQFGIDYLGNKDFGSLDPRHGDGRQSGGIVFQQHNQVTRWNWQNTLNFNKEFGDHGIDLTLGSEYQQTTVSLFFGQGANFADRFFMSESLISNQFVTATAGGSYSQSGFISYFGRANYAFKEKYLLGISLRNDALSNLPEDSRNGTFFGASVGYRLSDEEFYKNSGVSNIMNSVKLRGSYAEVGNVEIGTFPYQTLFGAGKYGNQNGASYTQAGNPDLGWETSKKLNVGADFGFLANKVMFTFDYFANDVDGMILAAPTPPSNGIPGNSISTNVGAVRNSGLEFTVNATPINKNGLRWDINLNFTTVKNEVKTLDKNIVGEELPLVTNFLVTQTGESQNSIYGYTYAGVNPANGNPLYKKGNGDLVQRNGNTGGYSYYDPADGLNESVTTQNGIPAALSALDISKGGDRRILGSTLPTYYGGLTNTLSYKGISLEVFLRFSGGNKVYNQTAQDNLFNQDFTNSGTVLLNRWTPENPNTNVPKMWLNRNAQVNQSGQAISRFVEDGDFLRIQNIILSYSLPKSILEKTGNFNVSSVRIFGQVQNLVNFSNYSGIDPEMGAGIDNNTNPIFRTVTFGINIGL
ncbi:MAG TPA: TonB-dependent receptor [Cyclobacteriaceae bacterium]